MVFDMLDCGGCKTCELVCSFHNTKEFSHQFSSLKVLNKKSGIGYQILLIEEEDKININIPCDGCKNLETPLCLKYCGKRDTLEKIINEFQKNTLE